MKNDKKGLVLIPKQEEILIEVLNKVGIYDNLAKKCLKSLFLTLNNVTPLSDQLENPNFFGIQIDNVIAYYLSNFESILIKVCQSLLKSRSRLNKSEDDENSQMYNSISIDKNHKNFKNH